MTSASSFGRPAREFRRTAASCRPSKSRAPAVAVAVSAPASAIAWAPLVRCPTRSSAAIGRVSSARRGRFPGAGRTRARGATPRRRRRERDPPPARRLPGCGRKARPSGPRAGHTGSPTPPGCPRRRPRPARLRRPRRRSGQTTCCCRSAPTGPRQYGTSRSVRGSNRGRAALDAACLVAPWRLTP